MIITQQKKVDSENMMLNTEPKKYLASNSRAFSTEECQNTWEPETLNRILIGQGKYSNVYRVQIQKKTYALKQL
jgi:hypothetical protein